MPEKKKQIKEPIADDPMECMQKHALKDFNRMVKYIKQFKDQNANELSIEYLKIIYGTIVATVAHNVDITDHEVLFKSIISKCLNSMEFYKNILDKNEPKKEKSMIILN